MIAYLLASACLLLPLYVHLTVGEKEVVKPLLASRALGEDAICRYCQVVGISLHSLAKVC